jgi:hypothetical protein
VIAAAAVLLDGIFSVFAPGFVGTICVGCVRRVFLAPRICVGCVVCAAAGLPTIWVGCVTCGEQGTVSDASNWSRSESESSRSAYQAYDLDGCL